MMTTTTTLAANASVTARRRTQRGMSLLEVLVAVLIFSFGLLGLLALQARAAQYSVSAEDTNRASLLANELIALMWAKRTVSIPSNDADYVAWKSRVADPSVAGLPDGQPTINVSGTAPNQVAQIIITWQPTRAASAAANRNQYQTQVMVQ